MKPDSAIRNLLLVLCLVVLAQLVMNCGADLHEARLNTGVLDQNYSFQLYAEDDSWSLYEDEIFFVHSKGAMPAGIYLTSSGLIVGTPQALGNFEFRISAYAMEYSGYSSDWFFDDHEATRDSEWFTIFVTENSTNNSCPDSSNRNSSEIFMCAGDVSVTSFEANEEFTLDLNFFINIDKAPNFDVWTIDFTVGFDPDLFKVANNDLSSAILRESATRSASSVTFDLDETAGQVRIKITSGDRPFQYPGRMIDLPIIALQDTPEGDYDFPITINSVDAQEDVSITTVEIDGNLSVSP